MTRYVNIELEGGPWDGHRRDGQPPPLKPPSGTLDGWCYHYTPAGRYTKAGRLIYVLTHVLPAGHPSTLGGDLT